MSHKDNIKAFYDQEAKHFHSTRQDKVWPEFRLILEEMVALKKDKLRVLELGWWSWRFYSFLKDNYLGEFSYVGVDISSWLTQIAQENYLEATFVCDDMQHFVENDTQEYDVVVAIASFQHLENVSQRLIVLEHIYRILSYQWIVAMTNWSFSDRFIKKQKKPLLKAILKSILTLGYYKYNDLLIPWTNQDITTNRYYHIFSLSELTKLLLLAGFQILQIGYIGKSTKLLLKYNESRNSFFIWKKWIWA